SNVIADVAMLRAWSVSGQQPAVPLAQIAHNHHVQRSSSSLLVYSLAGTRSEVVYRLVSALAAGAAVCVTATALAERFGLVAGLCAGLFVATNPMFVENGRDLRGYSLAALCGVLATVLFLGSPSPLRSKRLLALYGALLGLAIAAHVFAGLVLVAHVLW